MSASPHMSHPSAPDSPSSQVQGNPQPGYQSSAGYPSPAPHYTQQYTGQGPASEQYRASPTGSNGSMPLPSMRSIDPNHAQQAHQAQHMANSHLGGPSPGPYYHGGVLPPPPSSHYPNVTSDPSNRYQIPQDSRVMSGGRHKKVTSLSHKFSDRMCWHSIKRKSREEPSLVVWLVASAELRWVYRAHPDVE